MDTCFVRKDFYTAPPAKDASDSEWTEWLRKDKLKAAAAKRAHTKAQKPAALDDRPDTAAVMVKKHGRWKQSVAIGFVGDFENGEGTTEPIEDADQNKVCVLSRWEKSPRGTKSKHSRARRKANRKARKGGKK